MLKPIILKNGVTVLRIPRSGSNLFTMGVAFRTGSSVEESHFPNGISSLVEKIFWKGTYKHPSAKHLNTGVDSMGGDFVSSTDRENTKFLLTVPTYNQFKAVSFMAEIIQRSFFETKDIEQEKKIQIDKLKNDSQYIENEIQEVTFSDVYGESGLGTPVDGFVETVNQIEHSTVLEYLSHQYTPSNCVLILSGSFDSKKVLDLLDQEWGVWNPKLKSLVGSVQPNMSEAQEMPKIIYRQRGVAQTFVSVNFLLDEGLKMLETDEKNDDEEVETVKQESRLFQYATLLLINAILAQGLSSRLWVKTVEEESLFNKVESSVNFFNSTGFLQILGDADNVQFSFGLESILSVLDSLRKTTVSINELAKTKEFLKGRILSAGDSAFGRAVWQMDHYLKSDMVFSLEDILSQIDKVEAMNLRTMALDLFVPERLCLTILGTAKETKLVDKLVKKYLS